MFNSYRIAIVSVAAVLMLGAGAARAQSACEGDLLAIRIKVSAAAVRADLTVADDAVRAALALAREDHARRPIEFAAELVRDAIERKATAVSRGTERMGALAAEIVPLVEELRAIAALGPGGSGASSREVRAARARLTELGDALRAEQARYVVDKRQLELERHRRAYARALAGGTDVAELTRLAGRVSQSTDELAALGAPARPDGDITAGDVEAAAAAPWSGPNLFDVVK